MMKGFKSKYFEQHSSPTEFYLTCKKYKNPHANKFYEIIKRVIDWLPFNMQTSIEPILDLACGSGEVTRALLRYGIDNVIGIDPYLHEQYATITKRTVYDYSFEDIYLEKVLLEKYSIVFCAYALHLCSHVDKILEVLKKYTEYLCIITPHGLPIVSEESGWQRIISFKYANIKVYIFQQHR